MKRVVLISVIVVLSVCAGLSVFAEGRPCWGTAISCDPAPVCDGFLVSFSDEEQALRLAQENRITIARMTETLYRVGSEEDLSFLLSYGVVRFSEPNYSVELFETETEVDPGSDAGGDWIRRILKTDLSTAWGLTGAGVRVAVIDSGADVLNPDLTCANIEPGYDYVEESTEMCDTLYHGTKILQLICADDNDLGVTGTAAGVSIVPLRCFAPNKGGSVFMLSQAIRDAVDVYHCDIINMSWGLRVNSQVLEDAIRYAYSKGVLLVAAVGNVSSYNPQGTVFYPAAYDVVIGVSSFDPYLRGCSIAQRNASVTVCAPGSEIPLIGQNGEGLIESGTSFSAPIVTAEIAVMKQLWPDMTAEDLFSLIKTRATDLGEEGFDTCYGYGYLPMDRFPGDHGSCVFRIKTEEEERYGLFSWLILPEGGKILSVCGDPSGKTEKVFAAGSDRPVLTLEREIPVSENGASVSVFFTDPSFIPMHPKEMIEIHSLQ